MKTFSIKGQAINLFIKAESEAAAENILSAPLVEVMDLLTGVWFEKNKKEV